MEVYLSSSFTLLLDQQSLPEEQLTKRSKEQLFLRIVLNIYTLFLIS